MRGPAGSHKRTAADDENSLPDKGAFAAGGERSGRATASTLRRRQGTWSGKTGIPALSVGDHEALTGQIGGKSIARFPAGGFGAHVVFLDRCQAPTVWRLGPSFPSLALELRLVLRCCGDYPRNVSRAALFVSRYLPSPRGYRKRLQPFSAPGWGLSSGAF